MDMRDKVREAFNKKSTKSHWSPLSQPNLYSVDRFLGKAGYLLADAITNNSHVELSIDPKKKGVYHPEIIHDPENEEFYIVVPEHGELIVSDLEEVVKGYETAIEVVKYLEKVDLSKLEIFDDN